MVWYNEKRAIERKQSLEAIDVARAAVDAASDKQANNILLLDIRGVSGFADYFVICSGNSDRQLEAIYEEVEHHLKQSGVMPHHVEGTAGSEWLLMDYGDVIVHIFSAAERDYYKLEQLWSKAVTVVRIQ